MHDRFVAARKEARLRLRRDDKPFRLHDLRHTFSSIAIRTRDVREVMEWMGHADLQTTQKYLAYRPRGDAARRLSEACRGTGPATAAGEVADKRRASEKLGAAPLGSPRALTEGIATAAMNNISNRDEQRLDIRRGHCA